MHAEVGDQQNAPKTNSLDSLQLTATRRDAARRQGDSFRIKRERVKRSAGLINLQWVNVTTTFSSCRGGRTLFAFFVRKSRERGRRRDATRETHRDFYTGLHAVSFLFYGAMETFGLKLMTWFDFEFTSFGMDWIMRPILMAYFHYNSHYNECKWKFLK